MKNKTRIWYLVFLIMTVLVLPLQLSCKSLSEITQNMQQRTVQIVFVAQQKQGDNTVSFTPVGTGILVNDNGYVIIANHLLDIGEQYSQQTQAEIKKIGIVILAPGGVSSFTNEPQPLSAINDFDIIARDATHDLALLKIKMSCGPNPFNGKILCGVNYNRNVGGSLTVGDAQFATSISQNITVAMTGYTSDVVTGNISDQLFPETKTVNVTSKEILSISNSKLSVATGDVTYSISDYYQTDIVSNNVLSGSPVYSPKNGAILGISISMADSSGTTVVIPSKYILDLLKNNKVK